MTNDNWLAIISEISPSVPKNIDADVFDEPTQAEPESKVAEAPDHSPSIPPSAKLWPMKDDALSYIGVRVTKPAHDHVQAAFRLAAVAIERNVIPIVITTLPQSGFESFGFRTERLLAETDEGVSVQEAEIIAYWNLAIIVDIADVGLLG